MILSNGKKVNLCLIVLSILIICSVNSIMSTAPMVSEQTFDTVGKKTAFRSQKNVLEEVSEDARTNSKCEIIARSLVKKVSGHCYCSIILTLLLLNALYITFYSYSRLCELLLRHKHAFTVSFIQKSDGKK